MVPGACQRIPGSRQGHRRGQGRTEGDRIHRGYRCPEDRDRDQAADRRQVPDHLRHQLRLHGDRRQAGQGESDRQVRALLRLPEGRQLRKLFRPDRAATLSVRHRRRPQDKDQHHWLCRGPEDPGSHARHQFLYAGRPFGESEGHRQGRLDQHLVQPAA